MAASLHSGEGKLHLFCTEAHGHAAMFYATSLDFVLETFYAPQPQPPGETFLSLHALKHWLAC